MDETLIELVRTAAFALWALVVYLVLPELRKIRQAIEREIDRVKNDKS